MSFIHEDGFFHLGITTMSTVRESPPNISGNKREQQTQQRWIQQVAGNPRWERFTNKTPQERGRRL